MVDPTLHEEYDKALKITAELTKRATERVFELARQVPADQALAFVEEHLKNVAYIYGSVAAQAALETYKKQRAIAAPDEAYDPEYTAHVPDAFVTQDLMAAADKHRDGEGWDFDAMAANMVGHMMKYPMYASDWTMTGNANRDPAHPKWAFVPHMGACPWCIMVGSQGFVYRSEETAKSQRHTNCTCPVVVDFDTENPHLDGYDPDGMYRRMLECAEAGSGIPGSHDWGEALREARQFRDREWLRTGRIPSVGYDSEKTRLKKAKDPTHEGEFHTATILASHGYKVTFWDDGIILPNPNGKGSITVGRADLSSGVEIKTLYGANAQNTFDTHVRRTKAKQDVKRLVIDVSENKKLSDDEAAAMIEQALWNRHFREAVMIGHGKQLVRLSPVNHKKKK